MKNILAINFGGIGDEILFLPTLISLKKEFPDSKITLALEPRSKGIKDLTDVVDELFLIDVKSGMSKYFELLKLVGLARKGNSWGKFDIVISSGGNKLISALLMLMGIKERYGYDTGVLSRLLLTKAVPLNKNQYAAAMYHDLILPLTSIKTDLPEVSVGAVEKLPNSVLIHPGVSRLSVEKGMTKTVSAQVWKEIIDLLAQSGKKVMLVGGPDDEEIIRAIGEGDFENLYGTTKNLRELAELIAKCEKFVCSDSAPLHVGVALGVKTYAIFGPTDDKKLIPGVKERVVAIKTDCDCSIHPCLWEHRQTTCESLDCLKIMPQDAVDKILE